MTIKPKGAVLFVYYRYYEESKTEQENKRGSAKSETSKASFCERSGAVSGNSSSGELLQESSEHLSHNTLASQEDAAKLQHSLITHKPFSSASLAGVGFCIRSIGYKRERRTFAPSHRHEIKGLLRVLRESV